MFIALSGASEVTCCHFRSFVSLPWRCIGLDPHRDTPVEILHVILLGIVKYFWRDLINNQLNKKDGKKEILIARLNSYDTTGLGVSELAGDTLVNYAGSLTGRDFRIIAQVAPFVIYDLVGADCLSAWNSLAQLIPMIWHPKITGLKSYLVRWCSVEYDNDLNRYGHFFRKG